MAAIRSGAPDAIDQLTANIVMDAAVTYLCPRRSRGDREHGVED
jgi:hypothetical protein